MENNTLLTRGFQRRYLVFLPWYRSVGTATVPAQNPRLSLCEMRDSSRGVGEGKRNDMEGRSSSQGWSRRRANRTGKTRPFSNSDFQNDYGSMTQRRCRQLLHTTSPGISGRSRPRYIRHFTSWWRSRENESRRDQNPTETPSIPDHTNSNTDTMKNDHSKSGISLSQHLDAVEETLDGIAGTLR